MGAEVEKLAKALRSADDEFGNPLSEYRYRTLAAAARAQVEALTRDLDEARGYGQTMDKLLAGAVKAHKETEAQVEAQRKALEAICEECRNPGYPNEIVAARMIERIEEIALAALSAPAEERPATDLIGAAEAEVGRYVYRRIEALMDAKPGTPEAAELTYLAKVAEAVEEWGEHGCGGDRLADFPAPPAEEGAATVLPFDPQRMIEDLRCLAAADMPGLDNWARNRCNWAADLIKALIRSKPESTVYPAGWALVPVEPTPEMIVAHREAYGHVAPQSTGEMTARVRAARAKLAYRAMIAAAPKPAEARSDQAGWRPISEHPGQGAECLFWWPGAKRPYAGVATEADQIWQADGTCYSLQRVTHWMPLPAPPKAEADHGA